MTMPEAVPSSFRDPKGFVFSQNNVFFRQVQSSYKDDYNRLIASGLYQSLSEDRLLVSHEEVECDAKEPSYYKILKPTQIPFISYPYEWCFSQLKDAALLTLNIAIRALQFDMILKDASAFNVQFIGRRPILIDTLSFTAYSEGEPWIAYKQFCRHFLAPLSLMAYGDVRWQRILQTFIDGIPIDLASSLLPKRAWLNLPLALNLMLHAKIQNRYVDKIEDIEKKAIPRSNLLGIFESLKQAVSSLKAKHSPLHWQHYYQTNNYSISAMAKKKEIVTQYLQAIAPKLVFDLGANTGVFSQIAGTYASYVLSIDFDPACVETFYLAAWENDKEKILPLCIDLTAPSAAIGWANKERMSFMERGPADAILALALIHHLSIVNNVPLRQLADFFSKMCSFLIIEFIPKSDPQVVKVLAAREDIFDQYTEEIFRYEFKRFFSIEQEAPVENSGRTLFLMKRLL